MIRFSLHLSFSGCVRLENGRRHVHQRSQVAQVHRESRICEQYDLREAHPQMEACTKQGIQILPAQVSLPRHLPARLLHRARVPDDQRRRTYPLRRGAEVEVRQARGRRGHRDRGPERESATRRRAGVQECFTPQKSHAVRP